MWKCKIWQSSTLYCRLFVVRAHSHANAKPQSHIAHHAISIVMENVIIFEHDWNFVTFHQISFSILSFFGCHRRINLSTMNHTELWITFNTICTKKTLFAHIINSMWMRCIYGIFFAHGPLCISLFFSKNMLRLRMLRKWMYFCISSKLYHNFFNCDVEFEHCNDPLYAVADTQFRRSTLRFHLFSKYGAFEWFLRTVSIIVIMFYNKNWTIRSSPGWLKCEKSQTPAFSQHPYELCKDDAKLGEEWRK